MMKNTREQGIADARLANKSVHHPCVCSYCSSHYSGEQCPGCGARHPVGPKHRAGDAQALNPDVLFRWTDCRACAGLKIG
jgi:hypothetical protein